MAAFLLAGWMPADGCCDSALIVQHAAAAAEPTDAGPLLTSYWEQGFPYNLYAPDHTLAGCTAVAAAQIMRYWEHPASGTGAREYLWNGEVLRAGFEHEYRWNSMPCCLTDACNRIVASDEEVDAVAGLLRDVGIACTMDYGRDWSEADLCDAYAALPQFFKYRPPQLIFREDYEDESEWFDEIASDLNRGQPLMYSLRTDNETGHAVVVDGYRIDVEGPQVHINMGWGGYEDGYYSLEEVSAAGRDYVFVSGQHAVVSIVPEPEGVWVACSAIGSGDGGDSVAGLRFPEDGLLREIAFETFSPPPVPYQAGIYRQAARGGTVQELCTAVGSTGRTGWCIVALEPPLGCRGGDELYVTVNRPADIMANCVPLKNLKMPPPLIGALAADPPAGKAPLRVVFTCDSNRDEASIAEYRWDFDGDAVTDAVSADARITHTFLHAGTYSAVVTAKSAAGAVALSPPAAVEVAENRPPAIADYAADVSAGSAPLQVHFSCEARDPDGSVERYSWDYDGDGIPGALTRAGTSTHLYAEAGQYYAGVCAFDDSGDSDCAVIPITVAGRAACPAETALQGDYQHLQALRTLRDLTFSGTGQGRRYIAWYYRHADEITMILKSRPHILRSAGDLFAEGAGCGADRQKALRLLRLKRDGILDCLDRLLQHSGPALSEVLGRLRQDVVSERAVRAIP